MQHDNVEEARDWLARAERDLAIAKRVLEGDPSLADGVAFHAQQAVEKALKAFLTAHGQVFGRTHQLAPLATGCAGIDLVFDSYIARVGLLTPYAVRFRYPGGPIEPPLPEARAALDLAVEVVELVRVRISGQ